MTTETIRAGTCACGTAGQLFRTGKCAHCYIAELEQKYAAECDASMMAGSQLSALRLQLRDAEKRASRPDPLSQALNEGDGNYKP